MRHPTYMLDAINSAAEYSMKLEALKGQGKIPTIRDQLDEASKAIKHVEFIYMARDVTGVKPKRSISDRQMMQATIGQLIHILRQMDEEELTKTFGVSGV